MHVSLDTSTHTPTSDYGQKWDSPKGALLSCTFATSRGLAHLLMSCTFPRSRGLAHPLLTLHFCEKSWPRAPFDELHFC